MPPIGYRGDSPRPEFPRVVDRQRATAAAALRKGGSLSHHFDTPTARQDPRLNLCDMYLFAGSPLTTVMAMTVNPAVTAQTSAPFRDEAVYAFRFDTNGDRREDVSFKVRFDEREDSQSFDVIRADHAPDGLDGDVIVSARLGVATEGTTPGVRAFAGVVRDAFAGDAAALEEFKAAFADGRYEPAAFGNHVNFFHDRSVAAIVVEVPNTLIGNDIQVHAWSTVSLCGHAAEQQVARWGLPLFTHVYLPDAEVRERFNRSRPSDDASIFVDATMDTVSRYTRLAGSAADPDAYGRRVAALFGSLTLPYQLGTVASFDYTGFNGRALRDNVMDIVLSLLTNSPLGAGIRPDPMLIYADFPYLQPVSSADPH
jgi:Domain of unknown function (DUF4331)